MFGHHPLAAAPDESLSLPTQLQNYNNNHEADTTMELDIIHNAEMHSNNSDGDGTEVLRGGQGQDDDGDRRNEDNGNDPDIHERSIVVLEQLTDMVQGLRLEPQWRQYLTGMHQDVERGNIRRDAIVPERANLTMEQQAIAQVHEAVIGLAQIEAERDQFQSALHAARTRAVDLQRQLAVLQKAMNVADTQFKENQAQYDDAVTRVDHSQHRLRQLPGYRADWRPRATAIVQRLAALTIEEGAVNEEMRTLQLRSRYVSELRAAMSLFKRRQKTARDVLAKAQTLRTTLHHDHEKAAMMNRVEKRFDELRTATMEVLVKWQALSQRPEMRLLPLSTTFQAHSFHEAKRRVRFDRASDANNDGQSLHHNRNRHQPLSQHSHSVHRSNNRPQQHSQPVHRSGNDLQQQHSHPLHRRNGPPRRHQTQPIRRSNNSPQKPPVPPPRRRWTPEQFAEVAHLQLNAAMMPIQRNDPALVVHHSQRAAFEHQPKIQMVIDPKTKLCNGQVMLHQHAYPWSKGLPLPIASALLGLTPSLYHLPYKMEQWIDRRTQTKRTVYHINSVWSALPVIVGIRFVSFAPWNGKNKLGKASTGLKFTAIIEHGGQTYYWEELFCPWAVIIAMKGLTNPYEKHRDCNDCWNHYFVVIQEGIAVLKGQISWSYLTKLDRDRKPYPEARLQVTKLTLESGAISLLRGCSNRDGPKPCPKRNFERCPQFLANYRAEWGADLAANQWFGEYRRREAADRATNQYVDEEDDDDEDDDDDEMNDEDLPCAAGGVFRRRYDWRDNGGYDGIWNSQRK